MGEWRNAILSELGEVNRGRSRFRPRDASHLYGGPYPFIQTGDIKASNGRITCHSQTYSEAGLAQSRLWPANTMVITIAANIAETALLSYPVCFPDSVVGFIADPNKADQRFVEYKFRLLRRQIQHENVGTGSVQDNINLQTLERLKLYIPEVEEQRAISSILGALDDKIDLNRRMNETLDAMARAIFKDWFVDFGPTRAKMEGRPPYLVSDLWALFPDRLDDKGNAENWETQSVFSQANWVNGAAYKNMHFTAEPEALPVIKIAELKNGITPNTQFTNTELGDRYKITDGELLFSWSGNPDTSIDTFVWTLGDAWLNQHIFAVRFNGTRSACFLYTMLKLLKPEFAEIARNKQTTGLGHVTQQDLIRLTITVPDAAVEAAFDKIVGPLHDMFRRNLFENRSLTQTRDLLLPKLMSGEIRLREAEKLVEKVA